MLVTTVFAKDLDEGNNAEVIYSISSGKITTYKELRAFRISFFVSQPSVSSGKIANAEHSTKLQTKHICYFLEASLKKRI